MSKLNSETIQRSKRRPEAIDIPIESRAPLSANREPLFRRLIRKALRPGVWQGLVVILDQGFCSIANFLIGVLVARACSKAEYGLYVLGFTLVITAMGIQASLSGTPFTVLSPHLKGKDRRSYLGSTLVQHLLVSAVSAVGFFVAAVVLFASGRKDSLASVLAAIAAASVFILLRDFMRYVLLAQLRVWASLLMGLAANVATVGILLLAYIGGWLTAPVAYVILGGCSGLSVFFVLLRERKQITFSTSKVWEHMKENWQFGKWLVASRAAFFFAVQVYPWALMLLKGAGMAGVYGACMIPLSVMNPFLLGVGRYIAPKTANAACRGTKQVRLVVNSTIVLIAVPLALLILGAVFWGELALSVLFNNKYAGAGYLVAILATSHSIGGISTPIRSGIAALHKLRLVFIAELLGAAISVVLGVPLVYILGLLGAGLGIVVSQCALVTFLWCKFRQISQEDQIDVSFEEQTGIQPKHSDGNLLLGTSASPVGHPPG